MTRTALRVACAAYCVLTAAYAVLTASAFTYQEIIRPRMFGAGEFSRWHGVFYWPWLALALLDLRRSLGSRGRQRSFAWAFALVWTIVGATIAIHPLLPALADDRRSIVVALVALLPLVWLALIDHLSAYEFLRRQSSPRDSSRRAAIESRWLVASLGSAAFVTLVYAALTPIAMRGAFEPELMTAGLGAGLVWNAIDHALIFVAVFLALAVSARIVARAPFVVQYAAFGALLIATLSLIVQRLICDALGFEEWASGLVAASCATTIVGTWGGLRVRRRAASNVQLDSPLDVFFCPPPSGGLSGRHVAPFVAVVLAAWGVAAVSRILDWDFLLLKSGVIVLWFAIFGTMLRVTPLLRVSDAWLAVACATPLAAFASDTFMQRHAPRVMRDPQFSVRRALDRYVVYNPAFRVVDGTLGRSLGPGAAGQSAFLRFLRANTGLGGERVAPVTLDFVEPLGPASRPPHIFLFVIDSLRPDYLSPYNPAVTFTPRLAAFATDALVFRNAFTRYGGTGLSLPAIWTGAVGVHKQYVQPFWPMNTLEKLLNANRYRRVMSVDVIMEQLLRPNEPPIELDRGVRTMDYEMCRTLEELEANIPAMSADAQPLFAYSLPQDLHVSNIMSASVPAGESYPGFHAPYAARVRRIDRCFGRFVEFLKQRHAYDDSIIIVTSDHGEMLGEEGRWGHAYYLFPPVLQVPLLMHVPSAVRRDATADFDAISFLTDITPTIYAALGYQPRRPSNQLMGEPLIGPMKMDSRARRRADYVVAASYSAVYGVVRKNGRRVYIIDAVSGAEYAYQRSRSAQWVSTPVGTAVRAPAQRIIREHVDAIRRMYHLPASK